MRQPCLSRLCCAVDNANVAIFLQSDLVRIESTFERNSFDYELRIVDNKSGKERLGRKFLINQFFTRAGTFRDDIFENQFDDFCAVYLSKKAN